MTNFSYNEDIPDGPNNPSADQPKMKINTNSTAGIINVDHIGFEQNNGGQHRQATFSANIAAPGLNGGSSVLYSGTDVNLPGVLPWPFWQNSALSSELIVGPSANTQTADNNNEGYIFFGPLLVQWGFVNAVLSSTTNGVVLFPLPFKAATTPYHIGFTPYIGAGSPSGNVTVTFRTLIADTDHTGFTWRAMTSSSQYTGFQWFAIGKRP